MGEYLMKNNGVQFKGKCVGFFVFCFLNLELSNIGMNCVLWVGTISL